MCFPGLDPTAMIVVTTDAGEQVVPEACEPTQEAASA
jgi:hypothetical protein